MRCKYFQDPQQESIPSSFGGDLIQHALGFSATDDAILVLFTSVKPLTLATFFMTTKQFSVCICTPTATFVRLRFGKKIPEEKKNTNSSYMVFSALLMTSVEHRHK